MAYCKTPPFLEGASLSQVEIEKLTCAETHMETEPDEIMQQINDIYGKFLDSYSITNYSNNVRKDFDNF